MRLLGLPPYETAFAHGHAQSRSPFETTTLNMALDEANLVLTGHSPFDLLARLGEEGNGRSNGTRIELFVEGAAKLDRSTVERLLAA